MWRVYLHPNPGEDCPKVWAYAKDGRIRFGKVISSLTEQVKRPDYGPTKSQLKSKDGYLFLGEFTDNEFDPLKNDYNVGISLLLVTNAVFGLSKIGCEMARVLQWTICTSPSAALVRHPVTRPELFLDTTNSILW